MGTKPVLVVIGGGAAGFFGAIAAAGQNSGLEVHILEGSAKILSKVLISGGGRCNVTHACWEPKELVKFYPRGSKALLGPFHKFCTGDTFGWFEDRGVPLKIEEDGRVFPVSDQSSSIANALQDAAKSAGIQLHTQSRVTEITPGSGEKPWHIGLVDGRSFEADAILVAGGSSNQLWDLFAGLGHTIVKPVPSLFTFNLKDDRIQGLPGLSVPKAKLRVVDTKLSSEGPLLITHWGLSGPAILKLSAWGARDLADFDYRFTLEADWTGQGQPGKIADQLRANRKQSAKKNFTTSHPLGLPSRLWERFALQAGATPELKWADVPNSILDVVIESVVAAKYAVNGKSTFKDEFVTAGGIQLDEVDFRTFESKVLPGIYFAGEMLDIDAITGGFNFQAAWTGGWVAGHAIAEKLG